MKSVVLALAVMVLATAAFAKEAAPKTWNGYLIDKSCATHIMSKKLGPQKTDEKIQGHTRECAMMPDCVKSGYGIWADGKYVTFDKKGNEQVATLLEKSKKKDHIQITVTGTMHGKSIAVASVTEK